MSIRPTSRPVQSQKPRTNNTAETQKKQATAAAQAGLAARAEATQAVTRAEQNAPVKKETRGAGAGARGSLTADAARAQANVTQNLEQTQQRPTTSSVPDISGALGGAGATSTPSSSFNMNKAVQASMTTGFEETDQKRMREPVLSDNDQRWETAEHQRQTDRENLKANDVLVGKVDELQEGEKYTVTKKFGGGLDVGDRFLTVGGEHTSTVTVERTGPSEYKVTDTGDGGGKVGIGVDLKVAGGGGEAGGGGGSTNEYRFSSAEDAKRGADIIRNGPRDAAERQWLEDHMTSQDVGVKVGGSGNVSLTFKNKATETTNIELKGEASETVKYNYKMKEDGTVERGPNGQPVVESVEYASKKTGTFTGKGQVTVPPFVAVDSGDLMGGQVEIETRRVVKAPPGMTLDQVQADPSMGGKGTTSEETTVKFTGESRTAGDTEGRSTVKELETRLRWQQQPGEQKPKVETTQRSYEKVGQMNNGNVSLVFLPFGFNVQNETVKTTKPVETRVDMLTSG